MKQSQVVILEVEKGGKSFKLMIDGDTPLGLLHDALMEMKGCCVDRMIQAQKEEEEYARQMEVQNGSESEL